MSERKGDRGRKRNREGKRAAEKERDNFYIVLKKQKNPDHSTALEPK